MDRYSDEDIGNIQYKTTLNLDETIRIRTMSTEDKIIESYGDSYSDFSRISAFTGIPTIIGWPFHELQWRGSPQDIEDRKNVVDRIFLINNNFRNVYI